MLETLREKVKQIPPPKNSSCAFRDFGNTVSVHNPHPPCGVREKTGALKDGHDGDAGSASEWASPGRLHAVALVSRGHAWLKAVSLKSVISTASAERLHNCGLGFDRGGVFRRHFLGAPEPSCAAGAVIRGVVPDGRPSVSVGFQGLVARELFFGARSRSWR
jgi:hypothetical protein